MLIVAEVCQLIGSQRLASVPRIGFSAQQMERQRLPRVQLELVKQLFDAVAHRVRAKSQSRGDSLVRKAFSHEQGHFRLARRQAEGAHQVAAGRQLDAHTVDQDQDRWVAE